MSSCARPLGSRQVVDNTMSSWEYLGDLMSNLFKRSSRFSRVAQLLSVSLIVAFLSACGTGDSRRFVIGGVLPLTGDAGTFGRNAARGATLAVRQANESHLLPGLTVDFTSEDSRGTAAGAVLAARKLLETRRRASSLAQHQDSARKRRREGQRIRRRPQPRTPVDRVTRERSSRSK